MSPPNLIRSALSLAALIAVGIGLLANIAWGMITFGVLGLGILYLIYKS